MIYAALLALLTLYPELLRSHREPLWRGWNPELALGVATAALIYFVYFAIVSGLLRWTLSKVPGLGNRKGLRDALAAAIPVALLWIVYPLLWVDMQPRFAVVIGGLNALVIATIAIREWLPPEKRKRIAAALFIAIGTACLAIPVLAHFSYFDTLHRHDMVTKYPFLWLLGSLFVLGIAAVVPQGRVRVFLVTALVAIAAWPIDFVAQATVHNRSAAPADPARPNMLLITIDTLRSDFTSPYGGDVPMPALDSLAAEGVVFETSYSSAPWTIPSMAALFQSKPPTSLTPGLEVTRWLAEIRQYDPTGPTPHLADLLKERGYTTGGFVSNMALNDPKGMLRGFDTWALFSHKEPEVRSMFLLTPFLQDIAHAVGLVKARPFDTTASVQTAGRAFLREKANSPWFLWLHFMDPHSPYDPPQRYRTLEGPWPLWAPLREEWGTPQVSFDRFTPDLTDDEVAYIRSLYQGEMRYSDEATGRVFDAVKAMGAWENTVVCVTSDHGDEFREHGAWLHGRKLFDELIRVPLIMRAPNVPPNRLPQAISSIDVMPTLADLLGVPAPSEWYGKTWSATLHDPSVAPPSRAVFAQATYITAPDPLQAVIDNGSKLIRKVDVLPSDEVLFSMTDDPKELNNLATAQPGLNATLQQLLDSWTTTFEELFDLSNEVSSPEKDQEMKEKLEALGYL